MAPNATHHPRQDTAQDRDPRDLGRGGAQVIDLATRNVLPAVSQRKRGDGLGVVAGVLIVAVLGGLTFWSMDSARNRDEGLKVAAQGEGAAQSSVVEPAGPIPQRRISMPAVPAPSPVLARAPGVNLSQMTSANRHASPTVIFDAGAIASPTASSAAISPVIGKGNPNADFAARIGGVGGSSATAEASFDPATTITQGTLIPAVLETAIDTDVPGYVRAIVSTDVRSFDGARVLVPRSSRLIGQYKSGLTAGQKRAYVIWTRLIRPDGVSVNIGSPAIGFRVPLEE